MAADDTDDIRPPPKPGPVRNKTWVPSLNPIQRQIFDCEARNLLVHGEKGCRTGDTMIYTATGLRRLESLKPDGALHGFTKICEPLWAFDGNKSVPANAGAFWIEADRTAFRCELANGAEITGSPRHPLWVCEMLPNGETSFDYRTFSQMSAGRETGVRYWTPLVAHPGWSKTGYAVLRIPVKELVCKKCGRPAVARGLCGSHYNKVSKNKTHGEHPLLGAINVIPITENLAYTIGALVGDGSLHTPTSRHSVSFTNKDSECIARVRSGLHEISCRLRDGQDGLNHGVTPAGLIKPVIAALDIGHLSYYKRIPDAIVESPKTVVAAFLRGLFDTDGCAEKNGHVTFCTTSETLGRDVQDMLATFGIICIRRPTKTASERPTWTLSLFGRHAWEFGRQIGFSITRKQNRISRPRVTFRCPSGFNHNRYGYPEPIKQVMRAAWNAYPIVKTHKVSDRLKRFCSFKSIPSREKVDAAIALFGSAQLFEPFRVSHDWLEVAKVTPCEAKLFDLNVPGLSSFLASGTINHNSAKTIGVVNRLIRHCYENRNAMAFILTPVKSMSDDGGAWHKLVTEVLPQWEAGLGLHWKRANDKQHNELVWVQNQHGGWSQIKGISAPHPDQLRERFPGREPSLVFVDEITECSTDEYYKAPSAQLGRRPFVEGVQQFIGACNPKGPSHWVHNLFFVAPFDDELGVWDENFVVIYLPLSDNEKNLPPGYIERLKATYKHDPIEAARLIGGEWIDRPSGESLFREIYRPSIHVRPLDSNGDPSRKERLQPVRGHAIIIGLDPGSLNNAFTFLQWLPVDGHMKWMAFDEIVTIRKRISYDDFIPMVARRVKFWRENTGASAKDLPQVWASDSSAFNQFRAAGGSYDVLEIEKIYEACREKYGLESIKVRQAPKFNDSVMIRVQLLQKLLSQDEFIVSAGCPRIQAMLMQLEAQQQKPGGPFDPKLSLNPKRSEHLHVFDALTYPMLLASISPTALLPTKGLGQSLISVAA